ncbi:MAG: DUF4349 domain-containing protein [Oscillospiraceae bacterium]|nr:DUF4349 domain-containing protein [Oscillospiraceae bacterium]MBQ4642566.1 DUF4349 domain-containing protein [Oscillospiraceae bacterium]
MKRNYFVLTLIVLMILSLFCGCGRKAVANDAYWNGSSDLGYVTEDSVAVSKPEAEYPKYESDSAESGSTAGSIPHNQKLIRTLALETETEDLDQLLTNVEARTQELGGYVEQKNVYRGSAYANRVYRHGNLTIRIPAEKVDQFVLHIGDTSNIISSNEDVDDISLQYVATESRIKALEAQQTRLLELLEQAETMEDLLKIDSQLTNVRSELEQVTSQLRLYDNLVNYATIRLTITEVREYTVVQEEETFWQRIVNGLKENLQDLGHTAEEFAIFLITGLPYFLLIGAVLVVLILWLRSARRKRAKKRTKPLPQEDSQ